LGYVKTNYARKDQQKVIADIERYLDFYPQVDGFFLDEVSRELRDFEYYRQIYNYVKGRGNFMVVINPGARVPQEYYSVADKVVVFESSLSFLYSGYGLIRANPKDCFLVYGVRDTAQARELLSYLTSRGASCAYAVDEDPPLWFNLSPYMNVLLE
ncbi:MAG: spherulation-specific family 4 protein, partial [Aquificaceae bacterium]